MQDPRDVAQGGIDPWHEFAQTAEGVAEKAVTEFEAAWPRMPIDLYEPTFEETLTALAARQVRFFWLMSNDPHLWQPDLGSITLRGMTDGLVNLRLIATGGVDAAKRFQEHSMGNLKLQKLHIEKLIDSGALPADWEDRASELQGMIDLHKWEETIAIDLGAWNNETARENAVSADLKAEYDLYYARGSAHVHGEWSALLETVVAVCQEPLHRFHQVPHPPMLIPRSPRFLIDAIDLLRSSFRTWSETTHAPLPDLEPEGDRFRVAAARLIERFAKRHPSH
ncbi:MAG TPA: DUF5677 domain-containing protein [Candidatus Dormibacteraeota bacterium]|nr:DUF5677 domain-containing protein [Candidatus Dormibacteraeota bacterium]